MRRFALALLAAGCVTFAGAKALLADDPAPKAPLSDEEQARVKQLVDNLGSDDFRIREAATKELTEMGPRARTALEAATKSSVPEVRFRADQILRKLDGQRRERRLTDGDPAAPRPPVAPAPGGLGGFSNDDYDRLMKQFEEQMAKLREQADKGFGQGGFGLTPGLFGPMDLRVLRGGGGRYHAETADLQVNPRGARLTLAEKAPDGSPVTVTYEARSVDLILSAHPELRDRAGVASVVDQAKKAADAAAAARGSMGGITILPRGSFSMSMNGVDVRMADGKTTVKITEVGPDGKPVEKTYEGKDLDQIKREHPEIADRLGGFNFQFNAPVIVPGMPGRVDDDGEEDDGDEANGAKAPEAGPFGLALRGLDAAQRGKTGLAEGAGLVVVMVRKGSDADAAGLQLGDVVTAVDGAAVRAQAGIKDQVQAGRAKGRIVFEVLRDGKAVTLTWKK